MKSLQQAQFLSLGSYLFSNILSSDYPHKKLETNSIKAVTNKGNVITYRQQCQAKFEEDKEPKFDVQDVLTYSHNLYKNIFIQVRAKRNGELRYHLDFGSYKFRNKESVFFGAIKTNTKLDQFWPRFGMILFPREGCEIGARIERDFNNNWTIASRMKHKIGELLVGFSGIYNIWTRQLIKYDIVCNWRRQNIDLTIQHLSPKVIPTKEGEQQQKLQIGKIIAGIAYKLNEKIQLAAQFNKKPDKWRAIIGGVIQISPSYLIKAKVDQKGKVTTAIKGKINDQMNLTVGGQLNFQKGKEMVNFRVPIPIPFGYSIEFNI